MDGGKEIDGRDGQGRSDGKRERGREKRRGREGGRPVAVSRRWRR